MDTRGLVCDFGRHKGQLYTRIPAGYLLWMVNHNHRSAAIARAELDRRGTILPEVEISGHAIDRASLRVMDIYLTDARNGEGLHAWLCRMATEALRHGQPQRNDKFIHRGIALVIDRTGVWPIVVTVMKGRPA